MNDSDIKDYKNRVLALFKSGGATSVQWDELIEVVFEASGSNPESTEQIDRTILGIDLDL